MVKLKLNIKPDFEFHLIGIVTSEPIYRLGWLINEACSLSLVESTKVEMYNPKLSAVQDFNIFSYLENEVVNYELIHNKGIHGILIEEQKQIDYFLKISNANDSIEELIQNIKSIKNISLVQIIEPNSLKSKNRLYFNQEN